MKARRVRRVGRAGARLGLSLLGGLALLTFGGCPAQLENPDEVDLFYTEAGTCNVDNVFHRRCAGSTCHSPPFPEGALDLVSPGVRGRLVDQPALHASLMPQVMATCPQGDKYVDTQNPANSWLWLKLTSMDTGSCGVPMPPLQGLNSTDKKCIRDFVFGTSSAGGAGGAGGTAGTSGGGTAGNVDGGAGTAGTSGSAGT